MRSFFWTVIVLAWLYIGYTVAQEPKFLLSETEVLKLENLKLRKQVVQLQMQLIQMESMRVQGDVQQFVGETLQKHGNPKGVQFDPVQMGFQMVKVPEIQSAPSSVPPHTPK